MSDHALCVEYTKQSVKSTQDFTLLCSLYPTLVQINECFLLYGAAGSDATEAYKSNSSNRHRGSAIEFMELDNSNKPHPTKATKIPAFDSRPPSMRLVATTDVESISSPAATGGVDTLYPSFASHSEVPVEQPPRSETPVEEKAFIEEQRKAIESFESSKGKKDGELKMDENFRVYPIMYKAENGKQKKNVPNSDETGNASNIPCILRIEGLEPNSSSGNNNNNNNSPTGSFQSQAIENSAASYPTAEKIVTCLGCRRKLRSRRNAPFICCPVCRVLTPSK